MSKTISELQDEITRWGRDKGWNKPLCEAPAAYLGTSTDQTDPKGVDVNAVLAKLALVHSEVTEAVEAVRNGKYVMYFEPDVHGRGKPEGMAAELADVMIRCMHLAGLLDLDLAEAVYQKMAYNQGRPYRHGGKLA